jgi:hypothetical protein
VTDAGAGGGAVITLLLSLAVRLHYVGELYLVVAGAVYFERSTSIVRAELPLQKERKTAFDK